MHVRVLMRACECARACVCVQSRTSSPRPPIYLPQTGSHAPPLPKPKPFPTDRQADRQTGRQKGRKADRQAGGRAR